MRLIVSPLVDADLVDQVQYLNEQGLVSGAFLIEEYETFLKRIEENPYQFRVHAKKRQIRKAIFKRFNYHLQFVIVEERQLVVVAGLFHNSQHPEHGFKRSHKTLKDYR